MRVGFFLALRNDTIHYLHAASLVREAKKRMPGVEVVQLSDTGTPAVVGVDTITRVYAPDRPLLDIRLELYASCDGDMLFLDTDVSVRNDVRGVFADDGFDVALCDRNWSHLPQGEKMMHEMPFNTGVAFSRCRLFWDDVLGRWRSFDQSRKDNWMSEQLAVYDIVRTGRYRVKILPGMAYNYPPDTLESIPPYSAMVHFKGDRKKLLSQHAMKILGA